MKVEYIDLERRPALANQDKVTALGTVVFEYDGRTERVTSDGEQELTNGLIKVIQGKQHKVYFVQGHGEQTHRRAATGAGYSTIAAALASDNFATDKLVLAQQKQVPGRRVGAGRRRARRPTSSPPKSTMLKAYLAKGGKVLFLLDPPDRADCARAHQSGRRC